MKKQKVLQKQSRVLTGVLLFFIMLAAGIFSLKAEAATGTSDNPVIFAFDKQINGTVKESEGDWYTFYLSKRMVITGEYQSVGATFTLYGTDGKVARKLTTGKYEPSHSINEVLEAGVYKICIDGTYKETAYTLRLNKQEFSWGTINIAWNTNNLSAPCKIPVKVTLTGETQGVRIYRVGGDHGIYSTSYSGQLSVNNAGEYILEVQVEYDKDLSSVTRRFSYTVKPGKATLSSYDMTVGKNFIRVQNDTAYNGVINYLQFYENGKWVSKVGGTSTTTVTGLKADKAYKIRTIKCYTGNGKQIWGDPSKACTVYTATNKKPIIQSVKASNFKKKYVKKYWVSGYYDRGRKMWISGHWGGGYTLTTYKLKVTLKKKVPGLKTKYININGQLRKVKGKTYTINGSYKGKRKKKKITITASAVKDKYGANGAIAKKKVTIR